MLLCWRCSLTRSSPPLRLIHCRAYVHEVLVVMVFLSFGFRLDGDVFIDEKDIRAVVTSVPTTLLHSQEHGHLAHLS